jgi:hypothetical protein
MVTYTPSAGRSTSTASYTYHQDEAIHHYYLIEHELVSRDRDQHLDHHHYATISSEPARGNMDGQPIIDGWAGTTNDWAVSGRGEYPTLEAARAAMHGRWGPMRLADVDDLDPCTLETYWYGAYPTLTRSESEEWMRDGMRSDIDATTTDEALDVLARVYESEAESGSGYYLTDTLEIMIEYRQALRDADAGEGEVAL